MEHTENTLHFCLGFPKNSLQSLYRVSGSCGLQRRHCPERPGGFIALLDKDFLNQHKSDCRNSFEFLNSSAATPFSVPRLSVSVFDKD